MEFTTRFKRSIQLAIILLGMCSLFLATRDSLLYRNMTFVGNTKEYRSLFVMWGIAQSTFFTCMAYFIANQYLEGKKYKMILAITGVDTTLNIIAYLLPYQHPGSDFISQMHISLSFLSSLLAGIILLFIMKEIMRKNYLVFHKCIKIFSIVTSLILFLAITLGDFTGIMELVFLNGVSLLMYTMLFSN